jgi:hypothetical protein
MPNLFDPSYSADLVSRISSEVLNDVEIQSEVPEDPAR